MSNVALPEDPRTSLRHGVYALLITAGVGMMLGRILAVDSVDTLALEKYLQQQGRDVRLQRPFLSANDRSRMCTVRSLVEHGTYQIDRIVEQPGWDTIDMVKHDGRGNPAPQAETGHLYSSKPPLSATLTAGEYWLIYHLTPYNLQDHPHVVGRVMIVTFNLLPMILYFVLLAKLIERFGQSDWGRIFVMACAVFGTFLTTFVVTINNHLPAAVSAMATLYLAERILCGLRYRPLCFFLLGLAASFTAANELPALAFTALVTLGVFWKWPGQALRFYLPGTLITAAAFFGTNYLAHGCLRPPYAHRQGEDNWYDYQYLRQGKVRDSYWRQDADRNWIDRGEPSRGRYALHALVGHHGIFSLTPIWLVSAVGLGLMVLKRNRHLRPWAVLIGVSSAVCLAFYLLRPEEDRNYGGMTAGFRWIFWFAPLWLVTMLPAADLAAQSKWRRCLCLMLLAVSALSASYPTWNPWTHPWLLNLMTYYQWFQP